MVSRVLMVVLGLLSGVGFAQVSREDSINVACLATVAQLSPSGMVSFSGFGDDGLTKSEINLRGEYRAAFAGTLKNQSGVFVLQVKDPKDAPPQPLLHFQSWPEKVDESGVGLTPAIALPSTDQTSRLNSSASETYDFQTLLEQRPNQSLSLNNYRDKPMSGHNIRCFEPSPLEWNEDTRAAVTRALSGVSEGSALAKLESLKADLAKQQDQLVVSRDALRVRESESQPDQRLIKQLKGLVKDFEERVLILKGVLGAEFHSMLELCSQRLKDEKHKAAFSALARKHAELFGKERVVTESAPSTQENHSETK